MRWGWVVSYLLIVKNQRIVVFLTIYDLGAYPVKHGESASFSCTGAVG